MSKYCIGCKHLYYEPPKAGWAYSSWTYDPAQPAEFACQRNHWRERLSEDFTQEKFQAAMEMAETCEDYSERETPQ